MITRASNSTTAALIQWLTLAFATLIKLARDGKRTAKSLEVLKIAMQAVIDGRSFSLVFIRSEKERDALHNKLQGVANSIRQRENTLRFGIYTPMALATDVAWSLSHAAVNGEIPGEWVYHFETTPRSELAIELLERMRSVCSKMEKQYSKWLGRGYKDHYAQYVWRLAKEQVLASYGARPTYHKCQNRRIEYYDLYYGQFLKKVGLEQMDFAKLTEKDMGKPIREVWLR